MPEAMTEAEAAFEKYVVTNYPPRTEIARPEWHAPKLLRAAKHALGYDALVARADAAEAKLREVEGENDRLRVRQRECPHGQMTDGVCHLGMPGCACHDDLMASLWAANGDHTMSRLRNRLTASEAETARLRATVAEMEGERLDLYRLADGFDDLLAVPEQHWEDDNAVKQEELRAALAVYRSRFAPRPGEEGRDG